VTPRYRQDDLVSTLAQLAPSPVTETNVSPVIFAEIQTQVDFDEAHPWVAAA
jgi:hypothetical protein